MRAHDHGPDEGPGLACPERELDGRLVGRCIYLEELVAWHTARRAPADRAQTVRLATAKVPGRVFHARDQLFTFTSRDDHLGNARPASADPRAGRAGVELE